MPPQHRFGFHNKKRIAPTTNHRLAQIQTIRIAQARLRVPAVQREQLLSQAQILGNQQGLRLESGRNDPDEKANLPPLRLVPGCGRGAKPRDCQPQSLWTAILLHLTDCKERTTDGLCVVAGPSAVMSGSRIKVGRFDTS